MQLLRQGPFTASALYGTRSWFREVLLTGGGPAPQGFDQAATVTIGAS